MIKDGRDHFENFWNKYVLEKEIGILVEHATTRGVQAEFGSLLI